MRITVILVALFALGLIASKSCRPTTTSPPIPTSVPVDRLYDFYQQDGDVNPTCLDRRVEIEERRTFTGTITNIRDS